MSDVNPIHPSKVTSISRAKKNTRGAAPAEPTCSTGPRSAEGKIIASANSTTHGCTSSFTLVKGRLTPESEARIVLPDESAADWEAIKLNWESEYQPNSELHFTLVTQAAIADWMMRRTTRRYNEAEQHLYKEKADAIAWTPEQHALLERFLRYQAKAERAFYRARNAVEQIRRERKRDAERAELAEARPQLSATKLATVPKAAAPTVDPDVATPAPPPPAPAKPAGSLIQCITVQVIDGKTFTIFQPRSENLSRIILSAAEPKPSVKRALYFLHGIPEEYSWISAHESHDDRPHFVITRTAAEALADLEREREHGGQHVLKVA